MRNSFGLSFSSGSFAVLIAAPEPIPPPTPIQFTVRVKAEEGDTVTIKIGYLTEQVNTALFTWGDGSTDIYANSLDIRETAIDGNRPYTYNASHRFVVGGTYTISIAIPELPTLFRYYSGGSLISMIDPTLPIFRIFDLRYIDSTFDIESLYTENADTLILSDGDQEEYNIGRNLAQLSISKSAATNIVISSAIATIPIIRFNKNLESITIDIPGEVDQSDLAYNENLKNVTLYNSTATNLSFIENTFTNLTLSQVSALQTLAINNSLLLGALTLIDIGESFTLLMSNCRSLSTVVLSNVNLKNVNASNCTALVTIDLRSNGSAVEDLDFSQCNSFVGLNELDELFFGNSALRRLDLSGCKLNNKILDKVLDELVLNHLNIEYVDLSGQLTTEHPTPSRIVDFQNAFPFATLIV